MSGKSYNGIQFVESMIAQHFSTVGAIDAAASRSLTPMFIGQGTDDAYVDISLSRAAKRCVGKGWLFGEVEEDTGADEEGHGLKEPEQVDDIVSFLERIIHGVIRDGIRSARKD